MTKREAGRLGGLATVKKYGEAYMRELAVRGAAAFHRKYRLVPYGIGDFAITDRVTGQVVGYQSGGGR